jgi:hypothetical protein
VKCCIWSVAVCGTENGALREVGQKCQESFEMWCWRKREISWTNCVRNGEVLHDQGEQEYPTYNNKERSLKGLLTSCIGTAFWNTLKEYRSNRKMGKKILSSYLMTLRKQKDTENWTRKHIYCTGEMALKEAMSVRLQNERDVMPFSLVYTYQYFIQTYCLRLQGFSAIYLPHTWLHIPTSQWS